ncbi:MULTISPECIES: AbrB/MazE/SpoVT family DNA-binding domain-containing protein [unclassified Acidovorax]|uniref:AbrB/MazE/SpoVT family DNA-binding domain-containing protein n=1 Tax=unclassified Acidovorax TaxID=2684926 RepID=UPI000B084C26|nr:MULTISPECIES: hypothetical protein [unclassified Acidovorax]
MSMDRANYLRVPEDFPVDAMVSAGAGAQPNIGGATALAIPPSLIKAFDIPADQCLKLEATVDGEIVLTKSKYVLGDMVAQCDLKVSPPIDLALWGDALGVKRFFDFGAGQANVQYSGQFQPRCPRLQTSDVLAPRAHMERSRQPFS